MGRKGKKFIDKKKDIVHSFKVVRRSQRDPLTADENAPQGVLITAGQETNTENEDILEYGVFFDDDYDYLQHLRGTKEAIDWEDCDLEVYTLRKQDTKASNKIHKKYGLVFPSSAFESYMEEPVGLLNKAAPVSGPQPDVDPDIVAELDRLELEGEAGEEIPDDFFMLMNSEEPIEGLDNTNETAEGQHSTIKDWLNCDADYDEIPPLESSDDENEFFQGVSSNVDFVEEVTKECNLNVHYEDDEYEDIDEDDSDFSVSDDETEQSGHPARCHNYVVGYSNDQEYTENSHSKLEYDPLGYGGNTIIEDYEGEIEDILHNLPSKRKPVNQETASQTSKTSHSCADVPRPGLLPWLDERFEYVYRTQYSKDQWGALDNEDTDGRIQPESDVFKQMVEKTRLQLEKLKRVDFDDTDKDRTVNWIRDRMMHGKIGDKEKCTIMYIPKGKNSPKYVCDQNLKPRRVIRNQPHILDPRPVRPRIDINDKTGYPLMHEKSQLTKKALAKHDGDSTGLTLSKENEFETQTLKSRLSLISYRPPNETIEDKRDRKKAVKELRRERRIEKKLNKEAFKEEKKQQTKIQLNNQHNRKLSMC